MTKLSNILCPDLISINLKSTNKPSVLEEFAGMLQTKQNGPDASAIKKALMDREALATTGVGDGVAIPHAKLEGLEGTRMAVGISRKGVDFSAVDAKPVHIFFALIAPFASSGDHLRILAQISRLLKDEGIRNRIVQSKSTEDLMDIVRAEE